MRIDQLRSLRLILLMAMPIAVPDPAQAQNRVGGHFGFVVPLVTRGQSATVTVADDFVVGFPTGITIKTSDTVAFDLELLPVIQDDPLDVFLTVHPGIIWSVADRVAVGVRMAFDVNAASWGFTPLVNRSFRLNDATFAFAEIVAPLRFQTDFRGESFTSIGLGIHLGIGF